MGWFLRTLEWPRPAAILHQRNRLAGRESIMAGRLNGNKPVHRIGDDLSLGLPLRTVGCGITIYSLAALGFDVEGQGDPD